MSQGRLAVALADRYRIERELGQGGMATVYLAHDLRHDRQVALKVLRPELAAVIGGDRFLAEIRTTANLQHPHILPLFDSGAARPSHPERSEGPPEFVFYVMPLMEGESLRDRITRERQLPVADAVRLASEVAAALDYAHRHEVIHRDIKPENILLHDGSALVADFGIALAASRGEGGARMTETGMSLGTPHYMSPEQALGERTLDARTDIYALGCVLYEMLTGEPPFTGPTAQAIVARVMTEAARPVTASRATVPRHVEAVVRTALAKLPADRFSNAREMAAALANPSYGKDQDRPGGSASLRHNRPAFIAGVLAVLALAVAAVGWLRPSPAQLPPPSRLSIMVPSLGASGIFSSRRIGIAPDGSGLVYTQTTETGTPVTAWRTLDAEAGVPITGAPSMLTGLVISPDGKELVGMLNGQMYRQTIAGGPPRPLPAGVGYTNQGMAWDEDGAIWMADGLLTRGFVRIDRDGEVTRPLGDGHVDLRLSQILPGGKHALVVKVVLGLSSGPVGVVDLRSGAEQQVLETPVVEAYYTMGFLVVVLPTGDLMAYPFDPGSRRVTGTPVRVASQVALSNDLAQVSVAANGTVAYIPELARSLVLVDRSGAARPATPVGHSYHHPQFSPDGNVLLTDYTTMDGRDVWTLDLTSGVQTRVTFDRTGHDGSWLSDGRSLIYLAGAAGQLHLLRTRVGQPTVDTLMVSDRLVYSGQPLPGGDLLTMFGSPATQTDIGIIRDGGRGEVDTLVATRFDDFYPAVSADGRLLAWVSTQSGSPQVFIRPLDGSGSEVQVSQDGGTEPAWGPNGRELFYRGGSGLATLYAATIQSAPSLRVTDRQALFSVADMATSTPHTNYDVSPDGRTFAMVQFNPASHIVILQNLPELVRRIGGSAGAP